MLTTSCRPMITYRSATLALRGILFLLVFGMAEAGLAADSDPSPLSPPDTSSPRATLKSFRENMNAAFRNFYDFRNVPIPHAAPAQFRAIRCLDTSQLPPAAVTRLAGEAAILLNEVLDRVALPPYDEIPGAEAVEAATEEGPFVYRIPETDISIVEILEGPDKGEFLFSAETVDRAEEFYQRSSSMEPQPGSMRGLYELITITPGNLIPRAWIAQMPGWAKDSVLDQAVWKWIAFVLIIGSWGLSLVLAYRLTRSRDGKDRNWPRFALLLAAIGLTMFVQYLLDTQIILVGGVFEFVDTSLHAAAYFLAAAALLTLAKAAAHTILASQRLDSKRIEAQLITVSFRVIAWALMVVVLAVGAHRIGVPIEAVVGSLGVGGFAAALAARPTLENLIAGITLYLDRPVRVGDFCQFGDEMGSVEAIGLRSTRIRKWGGSLMSVPNSQFADFKLVNYNDMDYILFRGDLGLRLDTSTDQLRFVLAKLREMFIAHPKINSPQVRLKGVTEHALKIQLLAYVDTTAWNEFNAVREDLYMRTLDIIDQAGTRLAVPVQMTYFARDAGMDTEQANSAAEQVKAWRDSGDLPFPDMSERRREELERTLDYPPKGSVTRETPERSDPLPAST